MNRLVVLFSGLLIAAGITAQTINRQRLDSLFDLLEKNNAAMGTLVLAKNGKVLYERSTGFCDVKARKRCTGDTRYRIGSISKMFTAVMIFQLIEEGKISSGTTIGKYFPSIPNASLITVSQLLGHKSGLYNFTNDSSYSGWLSLPRTEAQMLALMSSYKPVSEPGEKAAYSNTNYVLLGYLISRVTGEDYQQNLRKRITSRLNLASTYYGGKTDIMRNESYSYQFTDNWEADTETDMSIPGGAGAIVSTPADLTLFVEGLFEKKLVSEKSLGEMMQINDGFGMGMFRYPFYTKKAYGHSGGIDGFSSNVAFFPSDTLAVAYCSNGIAYNMNDILLGVLSIYFNKPYSLPVFSNYRPIQSQLDSYTGVYASPQLPLKITITRVKSALVAQATGQPSFTLQPVAEHQFKFDPAGLKMDFIPARQQLTLIQGGGSYLFSKEK